MSTGEDEPDTSVSVTDQPGDELPSKVKKPRRKRKLDLDVQIQDVGPCKKHLKVTDSRDRRSSGSSRSRSGTFSATPRCRVSGPGMRPGSSSSSDFASRSPIRSSRRS